MVNIVEVGCGGPAPFTGITVDTDPHELHSARAVVLEPKSSMCDYNGPNDYTEEVATALGALAVRADIYRPESPEFEIIQGAGFVLMENVTNDPSYIDKDFPALTATLNKITRMGGIVLVANMVSASERGARGLEDLKKVLTKSGYEVLLDESNNGVPNFQARVSATLEKVRQLGFSDDLLAEYLSARAQEYDLRWTVFRRT